MPDEDDAATAAMASNGVLALLRSKGGARRLGRVAAEIDEDRQRSGRAGESVARAELTVEIERKSSSC